MLTRRTLAATLFAAPFAARAAAAPPVVVELFTSQGCSSCPPADDFLRELSARTDVLPLAFHVTYWDSLGWRDAYGLPAGTARQRAYAARLGTPVYTPQMVIDGHIDAVGSERRSVTRAIEAARRHQPPGPALALSADAATVHVAIGAGEGSATLLLLGYDPEHETKIGRGENAGRTLREANIVRAIAEAGTWSGAAATFTLPRPEGACVAALLQSPAGGYLAAAPARQAA